MLKTLLKKDLLAMVVPITTDRKKGRRRSTAGIIGFALLFIFVFASLGAAFFTYALLLGESIGTNSWIYMSLIGCMGLVLGLFGSVFSSYTTIYKAKDNELLLPLPIPPGKLLISKMSSVYAMSVLFCALGMLPGFIYSWVEHTATPASVVLQILTILFTALLVTALSCILGWLVALVVGLFPNKNAATVIASLVFLVVYYTFYFRVQKILQSIIANVEAIENGIRGYVYPIYALGRGATGHLPSFLIYAAITVVVFAIVCFVLSRTFIRISTRSEKQRVVEYREKRAHQAGAGAALLRKEFKRFLGSAVYMLNAGFGTLLMPVGAIALLIKMKDIRGLMDMLNEGGLSWILIYLPLLVAALICFACTMNMLTAPSISLEAKTLWLVKSLPVSTFSILQAKKRLHMLLTVIPAIILLAVAAFVLKMSLGDTIIIAVLVVLFIEFLAVSGLMANLKMPNLNWTSETVAVKQSGSALLAIFGGWAVVLILALAFWLLKSLVSPKAFLYIAIGFFLVLDILIEAWLRQHGCRIFEALQ